MKTLVETTIPRRDRSLCPKIDTGEGLTEQAHKNQCDINMILKDYQRTGFIQHAKKHQGKYDDVSAIDFQKAQNTVANVKTLFERLPALIRAEFNHEPGAFLEYVQNPANAKKLQQRGILKGNDGIDISGAPSKAPVSPQEPKLQTTEGKGVSPAPEGGQTSESASGE